MCVIYYVEYRNSHLNAQVKTCGMALKSTQNIEFPKKYLKILKIYQKMLNKSECPCYYNNATSVVR